MLSPLSREIEPYTYRCDVGLLGGRAGLEVPLLSPYGVRGVTGKAGVSGRGDPPIGELSGSVSERYDEKDSSRAWWKRTEVEALFRGRLCILSRSSDFRQPLEDA